MSDFIKHTISYFITGVLSFVLALGISVFVTRGLGPEGKGIYGMTGVLISLLITFTNIGFAPATIYYIGKKKYPLKEILGSNLIISFFVTLITLLLGIIIIVFFSDQLFVGIKKEYLYLSLLMIPTLYFYNFFSQILLGLQKMNKLNVIRILQSVILLIMLAVLFFWSFLNVRIAIIAQIISGLLVAFVLFRFVTKETDGIIFKFNKEFFKDSFHYGARAYLANLAYFFHNRISMFLINSLINPAGVGLYITALALSERIQWFSNAAGTVLFPKMASEENIDKVKRFTPIVCRNVLFITFLISLFLFFLSKELVILLYSEEFLDSVLPFQIMLLGAIAFSGFAVLSSDLFAQGKPMLVTYINVISALISIGLNILWVPKFGILGASWALSLSYIAMFAVNAFIYIKLSKNKLTDVIFIKRSDFNYYLNFLKALWAKTKK